ncbi:S4 domain-containing protein YaaA [Bacillus smithii]|uniref:S4 domain-containing protein YaaA n=1 Tax=Bacillus smithii TaxID=1479 RepID=UPI0030C9A15B
MAEKVFIDTDTITLGQVLKLINVIPTGGMAKWFLSEHEVYINGELDQRRGKKLKPGDTVVIPSVGEFVITRT